MWGGNFFKVREKERMRTNGVRFEGLIEPKLDKLRLSRAEFLDICPYPSVKGESTKRYPPQRQISDNLSSPRACHTPNHSPQSPPSTCHPIVRLQSSRVPPILSSSLLSVSTALLYISTFPIQISIHNFLLKFISSIQYPFAKSLSLSL